MTTVTIMNTFTSLSLILLSAASAAAGAQESTDGRWTAWFGCWSPVNGSTAVTCVLPTGTSGAAEVVVVSGDSVLRRSAIIADGAQKPIDADGCVGWESARFSDDGHRVLLNGELTCGAGPKQHTSGVLSISKTGHWIDVHAVRVGEQHSLRVRRSQHLESLDGVPGDIRSLVASRAREAAPARLAAGVPVSLERAIETSAAVGGHTTEAWVLESSVDAAPMKAIDVKGLSALADAKVDDRVIDVLVALSYPKHFQVAQGASGAGTVSPLKQTRTSGTSYGAYGSRMPFDVFSYSMMPMQCFNSNRAYYSNLHGYRGYGGGLAGCDSYGGWGMYPGWGYGGPITVVYRPSGGTGGTPAPGGRVVKGRGYTTSGTTTGDTPFPRTERATAGTSSGTTSTTQSSSGSSTSSSGSSTSSSSGSSSTTRTAKPRDP